MTHKTDPKEQRSFTDFSDYPQDGFGNLDAEKEIRTNQQEEEDAGEDDWEGDFGERFD